jgi:mannose-1-phosphate guanylyltransferase
MILHQVESLAAAGVTDIVLAVNYRPDVMVSALKQVILRPFSSNYRSGVNFITLPLV